MHPLLPSAMQIQLNLLKGEPVRTFRKPYEPVDFKQCGATGEENKVDVHILSLSSSHCTIGRNILSLLCVFQGRFKIQSITSRVFAGS